MAAGVESSCVCLPAASLPVGVHRCEARFVSCFDLCVNSLSAPVNGRREGGKRDGERSGGARRERERDGNVPKPMMSHGDGERYYTSCQHQGTK